MTEVTKQERLLYGGLAGAIRRLGQAAASAEECRALIDKALMESHEADSITSAGTSAERVAGLTAEAPFGGHRYDEHGNSPHTLWLTELEEQTRELEVRAAEVYRRVAIDVAERVRRMREEVPAVSARPPAEVRELPLDERTSSQ